MSPNHLISMFTAVLLFLPFRALACEPTFPHYKVGPTFSMTVKDRGKPVAGIEIKLRRMVRQPSVDFVDVASQVSNSRGEVNFSGIEPGFYFAMGVHAGVGSSAAELRAESGPGSDRQAIELRWPAGKIHPVRSIAGKFRDQDGEPLVGAQLSLTEALPDRVLASAIADQDGRFEFPPTQPALYVLHVSWKGTRVERPHEIDENIVVQLDAGAPDEDLGPKRLWSICSEVMLVGN